MYYRYHNVQLLLNAGQRTDLEENEIEAGAGS